MKRRLRVRYMYTDEDSGRIQIVSQSHRNEEFSPASPRQDRFTASDGTVLHSSGCPEGKISKLFVRGSSWESDFILASCINISSKLKAVLEYNIKYSNNTDIELADVAEEVKSIDDFLSRPPGYEPSGFKDPVCADVAEEEEEEEDFFDDMWDDEEEEEEEEDGEEDEYGSRIESHQRAVRGSLEALARACGGSEDE